MESNESETENVSKKNCEILSAELDEETCVRIKKKSRRVSFADITSVHVFDRDEDFETPPDDKPNARDNTVSIQPCGSPGSHPKDLWDKDTGQRLQLTPSNIQKKDFEDSVPEAGTPGSVSDKGTPDEDREFFGPVSLWHIAPGMSGLSPVSDDITLDCTTFSLQFGKLMCPDKQCSDLTEGVKTPVLETDGRTLVTEDLQTPVEQIRRPSKENAMSLTQPKKPITCPVVLDVKTLDSCEGMDVMSLIEEKQFNYDFASLSPDLDSMLAEKMSQIQTVISFTELNQGEEHFGSSRSQSVSASRKTGQGMRFKDSAGEEAKMSRTESIATMKQDDAKLTPDQKETESNLTIENMSTIHNKNTELTTGLDSTVYCFDGENQQQQQRSARLLSQELKGEAKNLVDEEVDRCRIDIFVTEHGKDTKVISDVEIKQSIIETVGAQDNKDAKLMKGGKFSSIKFEAEQQHKQTRRLSDTEVCLEPKKSDDLEIQGSTIEIMANKHCNDSRCITTEEGNQSMIETATEDCKTDGKLTTGNGTSLLNFERDQSQEKEKEMAPLNLRQETGLMSLSDVEVETSNINIMVTDNNAFGFTPDIESNQSMVEIAETNCEKDNNVMLSDDYNLHECEEQQQHQKKRLVDLGWDTGPNHVNMDFEMSATEIVGAKHHNVTEANQDVEMNFSINAIEANNCYKDIRTKPTYDSSLSIFDGHRQKQERKLLLDHGSDSVQKDLAVIEEASATSSTATNHTNFTTDAGINRSILEIVSTKNALPSLSNFKNDQHEEHEERLLNLKLGVKQHDVDRVETERTSNFIMAFKERNGTKLTPNLEMNQSATKTVTAFDNPLCKFEGGHCQEEQRNISLNLAQDMEVKNPVNVEVETSATEVMATKQITDTRLASGEELKASLEIMAIKHNKDAQFPGCDHPSAPSYSGKYEMQQELMSTSECEMHPQNSVNMERERSKVLISTTEQNDLTELTHKIETIHSMGIIAAKGKGDSKFVPDVKMNHSLAELHEKDDFTPSNFPTHLNPKEEHQQRKQQQFFISSEGFNLNGKSKLSEDQLIGNFKEAGSISEPIKLKIATPRKKNQQDSASSVGDVALIGTCASLENVHSEGTIELFPELDGTAERSGIVSVKDFFRVCPVSTGDTQEVCKYVDSAQLEVSSSAPSQPLMKHSIPGSESCHSKCNTISDSSVTPLKKPTELENVLKYPFTPDENLEDSKSKEKKSKISSTSSAYLTKSLLRSMDSKEGHGIPNNGVCTPKESSGNILKVNLIPSSQINESNFSVSGVDQCKNSSHKNKLSKNQISIHVNTPLNDTLASASHFRFPTQLISCDMKSTTEYKHYDPKQNMSPVHKDASLSGKKHHVLVGNLERELLSSVQPIPPIRGTMCEITPLGLLDNPCSLTNVKKSNLLSVSRNEAKDCGTSSNVLQPILASIRGTMCEVTRSGSLDDSGCLTNVKMSNLSEIRNEVKGCGTSSDAFSTPVNVVSCGDANYSHSHRKSIEHLNLCHGTDQIDVQNFFQERVRDAHDGIHVYGEHRLTTNFMDIRTVNTSSLNNDFSSNSHSKENIQGKRQEESFVQQAPAYSTPRNAINFLQTDAGFILRNANDSVCKKSHPMKLNAVYSSTKSKNGEEACCQLAQDIKTQSNHGNVSLPYSENECNSTQQNKLYWKILEKNQLPNYTSGFFSQGSMMLQHARGDSCIKTYEFPYVSEKTLPAQACDDEGYHGKKRKSRAMDVERGGLIKDHANSSLNRGTKPAESVLGDNFYLKSSEGRMHSSKKPFITRIERTEDVMAAESGKLINVSDEFCQGAEELHIPLIFKPKTLEEWLIFLLLSQPQLGLLQEKLNLLREDMDRMKISNNQQFQALDVKKSQMENKYLAKQKSVGSVKWLQQVVAYEKSKLLLLEAKKHELMKAAQELHSGCQESDNLKSLYLQMKGQFGGPVNTATTREEKVAYVHSLEAEIGKQVEKISNKKALMHGDLHKIEGENQKAYERSVVMKQELQLLGNKIRDICNFYHGFLKLKGDTNKEEIIKYLKSHVEKRSLATLILKDIQLWNVKNIKSKPGNHLIELSYNDFLYQRFVFEGDGPDANVLSCNRPDNKTIEKVFPFMNATEVFGFVLGLKQGHKIGEPGCISQVVAETSFLHGTLIYVLEEVQACRMRLQNLSFTQFVGTTGQELHLQLTFIDCTVRLKARVVLDMSNLRRAVYPSDVFPLQIEIEQFGNQAKTLLMPEEINEAIRALKPGYSRIKDLCGCISKLIESKR